MACWYIWPTDGRRLACLAAADPAAAVDGGYSRQGSRRARGCREVPFGGSAQPLTVRYKGTDRRLPAGRLYTVGRDPECDIVITDARVSWHHAALRLEDSRWVLADNGSKNGTFAAGRRVGRIEINGECVVRLGHRQRGA